jgi:hypothetical protein
VSVLYVDHHGYAGIPAHPLPRTLIDHKPDVCSRMLVDPDLAGRFRIRPVVAVFGDNADPQGEKLALSQALDGQKTLMAIPLPTSTQSLRNCLYGTAPSCETKHLAPYGSPCPRRYRSLPPD